MKMLHMVTSNMFIKKKYLWQRNVRLLYDVVTLMNECLFLVIFCVIIKVAL